MNLVALVKRKNKVLIKRISKSFSLKATKLCMDTHLRLRFIDVISMYLQCRNDYRYDIALDSVDTVLTVGSGAVGLSRTTLHLDNCLIEVARVVSCDWMNWASLFPVGKLFAICFEISPERRD